MGKWGKIALAAPTAIIVYSSSIKERQNSAYMDNLYQPKIYKINQNAFENNVKKRPNKQFLINKT